jgi:hypothetical protein
MRVLVASRGPSLAMILGMAGYDVLDARPGDAREWGKTDPLPGSDLVVVDLDDEDLTHSVVQAACDADPPPGVLVVTQTPGAWSDVSGIGLVTVEPPLSRDSITAAIDALSSPAPTAPEASVQQPAAAPTVARAPDDRIDAPPTSSKQPVSARPLGSVDDLRAAARDAVTLPEVASEVCALVVDDGKADAACLLLPDAHRWRVAGGANLRPLEHRIEIEDGHWLIKEMLRSVKGAVIDRSDVARSHLMHSPLAWQAQVAFVTDRALGAILIVGRQSGTFSQADLEYLLRLLDEAAPHLQQALSLRQLARDLDRFRDLP